MDQQIRVSDTFESETKSELRQHQMAIWSLRDQMRGVNPKREVMLAHSIKIMDKIVSVLVKRMD